MLFHGSAKNKLKKLLKKMHCASDIQKTAYLFEALMLLVDTDEYRLLSNIPYLITLSRNDGETIDSVYKYVFENFEKDISLDEAAHLANLTKPAFCRFFKARTQKTFSRFVNEIRVNEACRLLRLDENQIAHIAYACGFNSLPNFNKFFKSIKGITPSDYKTKLFT
jgi:AraC-like DNA-binding protein